MERHGGRGGREFYGGEAMAALGCGGERGEWQGGSKGEEEAQEPRGEWGRVGGGTEDAQLVWFVRLLGERRWDFLAQVSGLRGGG